MRGSRSQRPERAGIARLHERGHPAALLGHRPQLLQQHRLSDTAQPREDDSPLSSPGAEPVEQDPEARQLLAPARQLGRPLPGPRGIRIGNGVHKRRL